ncbi:MAG: hypothetical protein WDN27_05825 [Candidatus Saccharibacteria bacterium]
MQHEPMTSADLAGEPLPWKAVQWFYGRGHSEYYPDAFSPHVQPEDLSWHDAEDVLAGCIRRSNSGKVTSCWRW